MRCCSGLALLSQDLKPLGIAAHILAPQRHTCTLNAAVGIARPHHLTYILPSRKQVLSTGQQAVAHPLGLYPQAMRSSGAKIPTLPPHVKGLFQNYLVSKPHHQTPVGGPPVVSHMLYPHAPTRVLAEMRRWSAHGCQHACRMHPMSHIYTHHNI
eukprot:278192-Pyramimonas_sp.AAC.1